MVIGLHEWVVDGNHEDLASVLELGVADVARDMGAGTSRACGMELGSQLLSCCFLKQGERTH